MQAAYYGMITAWNKVSTIYDGTRKVLAVPNYLGIIRGEYIYDDVRSRTRPGGRPSSDLPQSWEMPAPWEPTPDSLESFSAVRQPPVVSVDPNFQPPILATEEELNTYDSRCLDGATKEEFTGMRAEFTSKAWFESARGRAHRRMFSWYGYSGNVSWRGLMMLLTEVHFVNEPDMRLPTKTERENRGPGGAINLTNLEKCLITKMFITTGMAFTKLADLWGQCGCG